MSKQFVLTQKQRELIKLTGGSATHILAEGGARSGKTFLFARNIALRAIRFPWSRHVILRLNSNACHQSVRLDTWAKVMALNWPEIRLDPHIQDGYDKFPNGSEVWFAGLDDKERVDKILGKEFGTIYYNEASQIPYASVLTAQTRLAQKIEGMVNRFYYDWNPASTKHWVYRLFKEHVDPISRMPLPDPENYVHMQLNPGDNIANIDAGFLIRLGSMPERYRKRFLEGIAITDLDGAMWTIDLIEARRVAADNQTDYDRVVVAVDPSGAAGEEDERSDEIGIVVVGKRKDYCHVLEDATFRGSPEQWGAMVVKMYNKHSADAVVGEANYGGDMVRATIHAVNPNIRYRKVIATRGKVVRAEPVSALFENNKMFIKGSMPKLEDELLNFTVSGYKGDRSPNRADAMVWAAYDLMLGESDTSLFDFYAEMAGQLHNQPKAGATLQ